MWSAFAHCCVRQSGSKENVVASTAPPPRPARPPGSPGAQPMPRATLGDVATLEAQAARLRSSIARRRNTAGCNNGGEDVSGIIGHYEEILERTEQQLRELRLQQVRAIVPRAGP
mmetsp:Transcript_116299/g.315782  ORF Transcript_116299/g.315782 Transcript_116299/m.315782 type:complete len:115 (+) Transcript_116299:654-998(+)